ncbi:MAG TPA: hypothetical protein P5204_07675 [Kiritimatiellia bacterium]|nr:hypothetical protein [Kiritimatiellia bacterium]
MKRNALIWAGEILLFGIWLCGLSFDQLRLFNLDDFPAHDGHSYMAMSRGNYDVTPHHKYRVVVPGMVRLLRMGLPAPVAAAPNADKALFYAVNLTLGGLMLAVSRRFLLASGASSVSALVVALVLGGCRFVLQATAQPMIDMGFYLALAALAYFLATKQWVALCLWMPLMALSKEVIYPLLVLPVFLMPKRRWPMLAGSYVVSSILVWGIRHWVGAHSVVGMVSSDPGWTYTSNSLFYVIRRHWEGASANFAYLVTPRGGVDILMAFGVLWPLAVLGARRGTAAKNAWLWLWLPYALWCGLLSRHWGRMLTVAFPLFIQKAAIGLDGIVARNGVSSAADRRNANATIRRGSCFARDRGVV